MSAANDWIAGAGDCQVMPRPLRSGGTPARAGPDLGSLERVFTIRANDAIAALATAGLVARVTAAAPGVTLRFAPEGQEDWGAEGPPLHL